jgi:hypothetical protein
MFLFLVNRRVNKQRRKKFSRRTIVRPENSGIQSAISDSKIAAVFYLKALTGVDK